MDFAEGSRHDLTMLRESHVEIPRETLAIVDLGYKVVEGVITITQCRGHYEDRQGFARLGLDPLREK